VADKTSFAPTYLGSCIRGIACTAGLDEVAAAELELAVSEACQMACRQGRDKSQIHIDVKVDADGQSVSITDDGPAWGWPADAAALPDLDLMASGSNTATHAFLIQSAVDESHYERSNGKNRLSLLKRFARVLIGEKDIQLTHTGVGAGAGSDLAPRMTSLVEPQTTHSEQ
jgi:anti-sigma regulatory factor (Ser/Thr protein kinase)